MSSQGPAGVFGALFGVCISEEGRDDVRALARDGTLVFILGIASSILTTYFLAQLGLLV